MGNRERVLKWTSPRAIAGETAAVWSAAEILHAAHVSALDPSLVALAAAGVAYGRTRNPRLAAALAAGGAWLGAATVAGPLGGPDGTLTWLLAGGAAIGCIAANRSEAVRAAKAFRRAKRDWLHSAGLYGLHGSHMIGHDLTRLGEQFTVDVTETGKLASSLPHSNLAELIAQRRKLPRTRVRVSEPPGPAGRIRISIRDTDPWQYAIPHPLFDRCPEIDLPLPATIREPLVLGQDPETGAPLLLSAWKAGEGGQNVYIISKKGGGKTTLLNCLRERLTACPDALVFGINVSKASEDMEWAQACHLTAIGDEPDQVRKALMILRLTSLIISKSPQVPRNDKIILPRRDWPAVILIIDEIDALIDLCGGAATRELKYIASKARSESVSLIAAGQRGTAAWMGGSDVRTQLDVVCAGKVRSQGEINHAVGAMAAYIPDMTTYGEGNPGVWAIVDDGGDYSLGRTFDLSELPELREIAYQRTNPAGRLNPALSDRIGGLYGQLVALQQAEWHGGVVLTTPPAEAAAQAAGSGGGGGTVMVLDPPAASSPGGGGNDGAAEAGQPGSDWDSDLAELENSMPDDLRDEVGRMRARQVRRSQDVRAFNESEMPDMSDISPEQWEAFRTARWAQAAAKTKITPEQRATIMGLLAGEGTTNKAVAAALGIKPTQARYMLERLRLEGKSTVTGEGGGRRWVLATTPADGDGQ